LVWGQGKKFPTFETEVVAYIRTDMRLIAILLSYKNEKQKQKTKGNAT